MAHKWKVKSATIGSEKKRVCARCGKEQTYSLISYDRMSGSTYRWVPRVGRCKGITQPPWNELMDIEAATLATMEADERMAAYDAGAENARDTGAFTAVPDGCPFPDSFIDGWAYEMDAMIEETMERR